MYTFCTRVHPSSATRNRSNSECTRRHHLTPIAPSNASIGRRGRDNGASANRAQGTVTADARGAPQRRTSRRATRASVEISRSRRHAARIDLTAHSVFSRVPSRIALRNWSPTSREELPFCGEYGTFGPRWRRGHRFYRRHRRPRD